MPIAACQARKVKEVAKETDKEVDPAVNRDNRAKGDKEQVSKANRDKLAGVKLDKEQGKAAKRVKALAVNPAPHLCAAGPRARRLPF
jgi:hypothetical protein